MNVGAASFDAETSSCSEIESSRVTVNVGAASFDAVMSSCSEIESSRVTVNVSPGTTSKGSEEEIGTGASVNNSRSPAQTSVASKMVSSTCGSEELEKPVNCVTPPSLTSKAMMPKFAPFRLPSSGS